MIDAINVFRLLRLEPSAPETTQPQGSCDLGDDYRGFVRDALARLGVPPEIVEVEIVSFGCAPDGRQAYGALLKLVHWDKAAVVRLLLGPALLETRIRRSLADSWLPEVSLFAGLWVRLSTRLGAGPGGAELKAMIAQINTAYGGGGVDLPGASARAAPARAGRGAVQ